MWKALSLQETVTQAIVSDRFGGVVLENILRDQRCNSTTLQHLAFQESILVGAWYIRWQRREAVKGEGVAISSETTLSIHAITSNYAGSRSATSVSDVKWSKPAQNLYKVNVDACFMEDGSRATTAVLRNH